MNLSTIFVMALGVAASVPFSNAARRIAKSARDRHAHLAAASLYAMAALCCFGGIAIAVNLAPAFVIPCLVFGWMLNSAYRKVRA